MAKYLLDDQDAAFFRKIKQAYDASGGKLFHHSRKPRKTEHASLIGQFVVKSISDDTLTCKTWSDDGVEGDYSIEVMKPYDLRRTPFEDKTFTGWQEMEQSETNCTVSYQSSTQRRLTFNNTARIREQIVTPRWLVEDGDYKGDIIYAASSVVGRLDSGKTIWVELSGARRWQNEVPDASIISDFTVGSTGEAETADTSTLDIWKNALESGSPSNGYRLISLTRIAFDATGDAKLYAYYRVLDIRWDGRIALIGAESRIEIADTEVCP